MDQAVNRLDIFDTIMSLKSGHFCASIKYSAQTADEEKESGLIKVPRLFKKI